MLGITTYNVETHNCNGISIRCECGGVLVEQSCEPIPINDESKYESKCESQYESKDESNALLCQMCLCVKPSNSDVYQCTNCHRLCCQMCGVAVSIIESTNDILLNTIQKDPTLITTVCFFHLITRFCDSFVYLCVLFTDEFTPTIVETII